MVARLTALLVCLVFSLATLVQRGYGDFDDFNLEDALKETSSVKQRWDHITTTTTRRPGTTRAPSNPMELDGFDLEDALDDRNDLDGPKKPSTGEGGGWSDKDLEDILGGGGYKPDKNKGGGGGYGSHDDPGSGAVTDPGTIAGLVSTLAVALLGAVSGYLSYQHRKFCFSVLRGLEEAYMKGENLEAVVCEEPRMEASMCEAPPVTDSTQHTQPAEPPAPEPPAPEPPRI
ncbi:CD99 molecule like 4 precursor [Rattus norvegicus]|uniref:CD99 molecule like 4 precursor n=1 Tax=Rattus norvegicus TaxID=10116 RepID=UPI0008101A64|nr:CD99 molecule like 4 precursor [Rattus norvegicus]|eukprot:XP_017449180.1 PREDICTED: CD99 antigen-like protein 2 isoform X3 [Rattus norvegicus]